MQQKAHVSHVSFIPKGKDTFRPSQKKEIISQFIFSGEFTIGSSKEANIIYKAKGVHPLHAKILIDGRNIYITDLFSTLGISVNGNIIAPGEPFPLRSGECFQLGNSKDLIRVDLFRMPVDPKEEASEVILEARGQAKEIRKEVDKAFAEAKDVDEKTKAILNDAQAKAEKIVSEQARESQKICEENKRQAIEDGHSKAKSILDEAKKAAEEMIIDVESRYADLIKKRDTEGKAIIERAQGKADEIIASGKTEVLGMLSEGEAKAKEIVSSGAVEKQKVLSEKADLERRIVELHEKKESIKKGIVELHKENATVKDRNADLVAEEKKFFGKYEGAKRDFEEKRDALLSQKIKLQDDVGAAERQLKDHREELKRTSEKNLDALKDLQATEDVKKSLKSEIEDKKMQARKLKEEIIAAQKDRKLAIEEAEKQREKTSSNIAELKKQFEDQYQRRKNAEEKRFISIRERETRASEERRSLLKKQEKERLPYQVETISSAIWNDLSVELQDQVFCKEVFESDSKIPAGISNIVEKSIMEEFDLRSRVAASVPTYVDKKTEEKPVPVEAKDEAETVVLEVESPSVDPPTSDRRWYHSIVMAILGALFTAGTMYGMDLLNFSEAAVDRNISSEIPRAEEPKRATRRRSKKRQ